MEKNTFTVPVTIELPSIEAKLDAIIELLKQTPHCTECARTVAETACACTAEAVRQATQGHAEPAQESAEDVGEVNTQPEEEKPTTATEDAPAAPEQPTVSRADIQQKVVNLSAAGKKAEVRDIVLAYNNTKVSDIPEDKLAEVWDKLTALEG